MTGVAGTKLFGQTDTVDGLFHVATKFAHVNYFPLFPLGSYLVLEKSGRSFKGISIPMSCKSILLAYIRAVGWLAVFFCLIFLLVDFATQDYFSVDWGIFLASCIVVYILTSIGRNASYERASELCTYFGDKETSVQRIVDLHFERSITTTTTTTPRLGGASNESKGPSMELAEALAMFDSIESEMEMEDTDGGDPKNKRVADLKVKVTPDDKESQDSPSLAEIV